MTGFARAERTDASGRLAWELRSVNHRYLDVQFRLPEEFRVLETDLRARTSAVVSRGKLEATLRYQSAAGGQAAVEIDVERLQSLAHAVELVRKELPDVRPPDALRALAWPGVIRQEASDFAPMLAASQELFERTLAEFSATREREGERLKQFLTERLDGVEALTGVVRERAPKVRDAWLARLRARCAEMLSELDPARVAQEAVLSALRLDVEEEMSRLSAHVHEVRSVLSRPEAVGRRLDFLMQELNREANTLSSKSQDEEMTRAGVDIKVLIEQMREQVQNIE
jgi:uncharacterized protein (TIGR00255 family)